MLSKINTMIKIIKHKVNLFRDWYFASNSIRPAIDEISKLTTTNEMVGAEIGVYYGFHSKNILLNLSIKQLFLIDPYDNQFINNADKVLNSAKNRLLPFQNKIKFVRKTSVDALQHVPDNLDFVYIDGDHSYEVVKQDFQNYFPKVRGGGIIGGHDYDLFPGVKKAIDEMCDEMNLTLFHKNNDWWILK